MINLFLKLYEAFEANKELFTEAGLEPVKHMDRYRGQPLAPQQFEYYDIPAIFIDWRIKWEKQGKLYNGKLQLDFHIVTDATWETSNISTNREEGLKNTVYYSLIRAILDGLESENTSKLKRLEENPVDASVINYLMMQYECNYSDPMLGPGEYVEVLIQALKINGTW